MAMFLLFFTFDRNIVTLTEGHHTNPCSDVPCHKDSRSMSQWLLKNDANCHWVITETHVLTHIRQKWHKLDKDKYVFVKV